MQAWISEARDFGRTFELRFVEERFGRTSVSVGVTEDGSIIMQDLDEGVRAQGYGIMLSRDALDALVAAARERDHDEWKARYEEQTKALDRAEARVEQLVQTAMRVQFP